MARRAGEGGLDRADLPGPAAARQAGVPAAAGARPHPVRIPRAQPPLRGAGSQAADGRARLSRQRVALPAVQRHQALRTARLGRTEPGPRRRPVHPRRAHGRRPSTSCAWQRPPTCAPYAAPSSTRSTRPTRRPSSASPRSCASSRTTSAEAGMAGSSEWWFTSFMAYRKTPAEVRRLEAARERLVVRATEVVADIGWAQASVTAVADAAGIAMRLRLPALRVQVRARRGGVPARGAARGGCAG